MYPDFKELLSALNAHRVKYLIFGAYAVSIHAQPRATKDMDLLVKPDADNARAVYAALAQFGAPLEGMTLRTLRKAALSSAWDANPLPWTFFRKFPASISMQHGNAAWKM
jgi:hypothetical protein